MFRFTIRELVLLTAIVALVLGWGFDHRRHQVALLTAETRLESEHCAWLGQIESYIELSDAIRRADFEVVFSSGTPQLRQVTTLER